MPSVVSLWRDLSRSVRIGVVTAALGVGIGVPVALAGPWVRAQVSERAERRGFTVAIEHVKPSWAGIWLLGVHARSRTGRVTGRVDAVLVPFGGRPIEVHGGYLSADGSPEELRAELGADRKETSSAHGRRRVSVDGLALRWVGLDGRGTALEAWGIADRREASADRIRVDLARVDSLGSGVEVRGVELELGASGTGRLHGLRVASAEAAVDVDGLRGRGAGASGGPTRPASVSAPVAPGSMMAPARLALGLSALEAVAQSAMPEGAEVAVDSGLLRARFRGEHLGFGPSRVSVKRVARALELEVTPSERASAGTTPLALRGRVPVDGGAPSLELEGGPVDLALLGVHDGELGLTHTRDATLEAHVRLELADGVVRGSGTGSLANLSLDRRELSLHEVRGLRLGFRVNGEAALDGSHVKLEDSELRVGEVKLAGNADFTRDEAGSHLVLAGGVPLASCDAVLTSIPEALMTDALGVKLAGTFALDSAVHYDSAHPDGLDLTLHVENGCHVVDAPRDLSPARFESVWEREVKGPDGVPMTIRSGPGSPDWVPYDQIPHAMEVAVLVCEDGGFYRHHGFDFRAMQMAIKDDIRAGRFVRGASTISMQLAKNLYLGKQKTLARKVEEAVLTMLLESRLSKQQLMELYLNVVELGPGIYGIEQAARYYFDEDARDLSLAQALYLASILPDPTRPHFEPDGQVTKKWGAYIHKLMHIARRVNRITDEELEAGLAEELGFRKGNGEAGSRDFSETEPAALEQFDRELLRDDAVTGP